MTLRSRARLAWSLLGLYVLLIGVALLLSALTNTWGWQLAWPAIFAGFPVVGALVASRGAGGPIGWICLAVGLAVVAAAVMDGYAIYALRTSPGSLPGGAYAAWFTSFGWVGFIGLIAVYLILFFPDGRLPSRRWRPLPWIAAAGMSLTVTGIAVSPGRLDIAPLDVQNPFGIEGAKPFLPVIWGTGLGLLFGSMLATAASIVVRFRRSRGEERQQIKWFATAVVVTIILFFLGWPAGLVSHTLEYVLNGASVIAWVSLPIAIGIAILRYRLYDIDLVLNKALVFGALAAFITALYVAIVVGVSALVGRAGEPDLALSLLATAVVAVAFQPARERAQRLANRLVYGRRATPYEVLSAFSAQAAATLASEEVLPHVARTVAQGTGAARSEVWVASGSQLRLAAAWPERADAARPLPLEDGRLPALPEVDLAVPVRHQAELLGALAVTKPRGEALTPAEEKLLHDLAAQAGLVLRNVGLTAELLARLQELRASRQRLVSAQDAERRRLERDLHDGAQQHLVALKVKLALAARQAGEPALKQALASLQQDSEEAIEALRELARGIYPPLLAEQGLAAAIEAQARKAPLAVTLEAEGLARYPPELEAAVYFCCLEALQNVGKYANASQATVRLAEEEGELRFSVSDDGVGFDPAAGKRGAGLQNMADRLEALGGSFSVESAPGAGTTVSGRVPFRVASPANEAPRIASPQRSAT